MQVITLVHTVLDHGNGVLVGLPAYLICQLHSVLSAAAYLIYHLRSVTTSLMLSSAFNGCRFQSAYSTSSLFWRTMSYMESHHPILVHSSPSLIYLVDECCVLLAQSVLLYHQLNCLQLAVEPFRSPLHNSGTPCLMTSFWPIHC